MMSMSIAYKDTGRRAQKERTWAALVDAARALIADGTTPTVEAAAAAASISRATAYRYFRNAQELMVAAHPEVAATSLLREDAPTDPEARLDAAVVGLARIFLDAEPSYRAMLRLSLEPDTADRGELALRTGRRFLWIEDALEPLRDRLEPGAFARLVQAVAVVAGIEALVTLTDLAGLDRDEAVEVMRWSARSLVRASLADPG